MPWPKGLPQSPEHRAKKIASRLASGKPSPRKGRRAPVMCAHPERPHFAKGMCRSCYQIDWQRAHPRATTWAQDHPERQKYLLRRHTLRSRYGITPEDVENLWRQQEGRCANPGCAVERPLGGLEVDHDHVTGRVRGLLCPSCNKALGNVNDDKGRLAGLIKYLASA